MAPEKDGTILIVDDAPENLVVLSQLLEPHYTVLAATGGAKALSICARDPRPDLLLLDIMMPEMDGYELFDRLQADDSTRGIPVIFVTAMDGNEAELRGLNHGAVDYITKPIHPAILLARVGTQLELKHTKDRLTDQNAWLEAELIRRMGENEVIQRVSIRALAHLAEIRDPETGNHILRTQEYVRLLAEALQNHPRFNDVLNDHYIQILARSAPLHDLGKVGIPDAVLQKPGKLTPVEWAIMKTHAALGADAIEQAESDIEQEVEFLSVAKEIARSHHEKWDGGGYPDGLSGSAIPVSARIMAVADVFDALISVRVYKAPMSYAKAWNIISEGRGRHFDPDITDAFLENFSEFTLVADRFRDVPDEQIA